MLSSRCWMTAPETVSYLEFRADYRVELRFDDGRSPRFVPFLKLPLSDLPADFFPMTCKTCVDYTNRLADITVGYMAGDGDQWLIVRNARGQRVLERLGDRLAAPTADRGQAQRRRERASRTTPSWAPGGLPLRRMPGWLRPSWRGCSRASVRGGWNSRERGSR